MFSVKVYLQSGGYKHTNQITSQLWKKSSNSIIWVPIRNNFLMSFMVLPFLGLKPDAETCMFIWTISSALQPFKISHVFYLDSFFARNALLFQWLISHTSSFHCYLCVHLSTAIYSDSYLNVHFYLLIRNTVVIDISLTTEVLWWYYHLLFNSIWFINILNMKYTNIVCFYVFNVAEQGPQ